MDLKKVFVFRMFHIENIAHIIDFGITHRNSKNANSNYKPIGDNSLISTRNSYQIIEGKLIGDYIPFYFSVRTPMLYVIQKGFNGVKAVHPSNIVYAVVSIHSLLKSNINFIYTNGHATDNFTNIFQKDQIENIENQLDFDAIKAKYWRDENDLDLKRRKEAELLLESDLPFSFISGFVVYDEKYKNDLIELGIPENKLYISENYYF